MTDIIRASAEPSKFPLGKIFFNTGTGKYYANLGTYDVPIFKDITFGISDEITAAIDAFRTEIGFDLPLIHTSETNRTGCYDPGTTPSSISALAFPSGNRRSGSTHTVTSTCRGAQIGGGRRTYTWNGSSWI